MKYAHVYVLFLMFVFFTSCGGQNKTDLPKEKIKSETKDASTSRWIYTKYEYADSMGKHLIIHNSFPRGGGYIDPNGKKYPYAVFYTQITNETINPIELKIDFPIDSFEIPPSSGNYMKLLLPSDTMTIDKEPLYDYGLTIKSFLDNNRHKSSSLKRTINPKESTAFYVVTLSTHGVGGTLRTGLSLKGQNLFYRINDKEIPCGNIDLTKLMLQK